jgi:hypothetical protein
MAMDHTIPELDGRGLRQFGLTTGAIVAALFGLFFPWLLERNWPLWPWLIAGPLWALALIYPVWLRLIYRGWMRFGLLASRIMTPLVLGIVFFLVVTPLALVRRLSGRDAMRRNFDPNYKSYRVPSEKPALDRLEKPF